MFRLDAEGNHAIKVFNISEDILNEYRKNNIIKHLIEQKGMTFDHNIYVVIGKQCRTENVYACHKHNTFI